MRPHVLSAPLVCLLLAACGSAGNVMNPPPPRDHDGGPDPDGGVSLVGSYDLQLETTGKALVARVDLRETESGLAAVVLPRWGSPAAMKVSRSAVALTLTGTVSFDVVDPRISYDQADTITLAIGADGRIAPSADAHVTPYQLDGDVTMALQPLTLKGSIGPDKTPPEARIDTTGYIGPLEGGSFPWSQLTLHVAEGVDLDKQPIVIHDAAGHPRPQRWTVSPPTDDTASSGAEYATGRLTAWDELTGLSVTAGPFHDPAGLSGGGELPLSVIDIGPAVAGQPFDGEAVHVATWGTAHVATSADPLCAGGTGGCMVIPSYVGTLQGFGCSPHVGFAGHLATAGKSKVTIRYRYLASNDVPTGAFSTPVVEIAVPGADGSVNSSQLARTWTPLPAPIQKLTQGTAWTDEAIVVPAGATELGYAIYTPPVMNPGGYTDPCGPIGADAMDAAIIVDAIGVE